MAKKKKYNHNYAYEIITKRIVKYIDEHGEFPWRKPWATLDKPQQNFKSKRPYQNINQFMCLMSGFESPYWLTLKQANELGGRIIKGSKSTPIVYYQPPSDEQKEKITNDPTLSEQEKEYRLSRLFGFVKPFWIFNAQQIEGIDFPEVEVKLNEFDPIEKAEEVIKNMPNPPKIIHKGGQAYYSRLLDEVVLPPMGYFDTVEDYYSTLYHEVGHSTGHKTRLNWVESGGRFGSKKYGLEELTVELVSAFSSNEVGIYTKAIERNTAAYIAGWNKVFGSDPKIITQAMSRAIPSTNYIFGRL